MRPTRAAWATSAASCILAMLRDHQPYRDPGIDYQALVVERNASRWLRNLKRYGYLEGLQAAAAASA